MKNHLKSVYKIKKRLIFVIPLLVTFTFLTSCVSSTNDNTDPETPDVSTHEASDISSSNAQLNGRVNPNGRETNVVFEYGTSSSYGNSITATQSPISGAEEQDVSSVADDLEAGTTYHFRVTAVNAEGEDIGEDQTFTTGGS